jgi:hypothetical protein
MCTCNIALSPATMLSLLLHCATAQAAQCLGVIRVLCDHDAAPARTSLLSCTWRRTMSVPACYSQELCCAGTTPRACRMHVASWQNSRSPVLCVGGVAARGAPHCSTGTASQPPASCNTAPQSKPVSKIKHCVLSSHRHNAGTSADEGMGSLPGRGRSEDGAATSIPTWLI